MKIYEDQRIFIDFVICCGYRGQFDQVLFVNYFTAENDDTGTIHSTATAGEFLGQPSEKWKVTRVDTGIETLTGGAFKRIAPYVDGEKL